MKKTLDIQIGGNHYKKMPFQPVELFAKTHCTAFQANIWKYITRYKYKNGKEDIEKCKHYAQLAIALGCKGHISYKENKIIETFCEINNLSPAVSNIVKLAGFDLYAGVIKACDSLLRIEYPVNQQ